MRFAIMSKIFLKGVIMAKKNLQNKEFKSYNIGFICPEQGVDYHWCYQNSSSLHSHDYYEFIIITDGKLKHLHQSQTTIASKGMLFLIKPGEYHQFLPYHNSHAKQINFAITPQMLKSFSETIWQHDIFEKINNWDIPNNLILPQQDLDRIFDYAERLNQYSSQSKNIYALIKTIILELLICLIEKLESNEPVQAKDLPTWFTDFLTLLKTPNVFTMKLKDIYPLAPYSQSMLNVYFNKYMDMTLIAYITNLKISYACNLLRYTDDSPLDISNKLEYDSLSHFNRVFKKVTGKSPIAYKKSINPSTNK